MICVGSVLALQGMIQCQVIEGHYDDAEAQIDLFHVMHGSFIYLSAYMYIRNCDQIT